MFAGLISAEIERMRYLLACSVLLLSLLGISRAGDNSVISLSHYDEKPLDFSSLQRSGLEGIIHEATYPSFDRDSKYGWRQNEAARAGLRWGAYCFGNSYDGRRQADHFLDVVSTEWVSGARPTGGVLLVLDAEQNNHYPGGSMGVEQAVRFVERVHDRTGIYPGLYSNENWIKKVFNNPSIDSASRATLSKCWLWIANYHEIPSSTAPWARWTLWQYTGDGICGLPRSRFPTAIGGFRNAERTIFSGDRASLRKFWSDHSWSPDHALVAKGD